MHDQARAWVKANWQAASHIVDVGGRNVNYGTVRELWPDAKSYVAIDLYEGDGVDWVGDFLDYIPDSPVDMVICMEVFEHVEHWSNLVAHAAEILHPGWGVMLVTAAGDGRRPHSGVDGGPVRHGEWYRNLGLTDLLRCLDQHFRLVQGESGPGEPLALLNPVAPGDVYAKARYPR